MIISTTHEAKGIGQLIAHQRRRRDEMAIAHPREAATRLDGYSVETISRADAVPIIMHYEWLRTVGKATIFVGLLSPSREIEGVACFGHGPSGHIRSMIGEPALCLERGACVHYAPPNAASFLITRACKLVHRVYGNSRFFAYADPMAGEYGAVYQSANWFYVGQGLNGGKGRKERAFVLVLGDDPNEPSSWQTTRVLRRRKDEILALVAAKKLRPILHESGKNRGKVNWYATAKSVGWEIAEREAKHVYAVSVGRDRKRWRKELLAIQIERHKQPLPYPAPHPERKRKAGAKPTDVRFQIVPPPTAEPYLF